MQRTGLIVSISSDIGAALAQRWLANGWAVVGTFRHESVTTQKLRAAGAALVHCELTAADSLAASCAYIKDLGIAWDVLVLAAGTTEPIGAFSELNFDDWARSIDLNFTSQMRLTHYMLGLRNAQSTLEPCVIYFAGGGTNNATPNYSAYTLSKIALIKMCELLHAEIPDVRFTIVGPGWVNTKIHQETLQAGTRAGANYARTVEVIQHNTFTAMERVLDCCDWLSTAPRSEIGGRNFSVAHDAWGTEALRCALRADPDMYKLRRAGNALTFSHPMQQA